MYLCSRQALWNYLIDTSRVIDALGEDEADFISNDLLEYLGLFANAKLAFFLFFFFSFDFFFIAECFFFLSTFPDEERIFKSAAPDPLWEQFAIVAADLLERIQASMSYNNTPCDTSDDEHDHERNDVENAHFHSDRFKKWLQDF